LNSSQKSQVHPNESLQAGGIPLTQPMYGLQVSSPSQYNLLSQSIALGGLQTPVVGLQVPAL
jgi:hypothetical protein